MEEGGVARVLAKPLTNQQLGDLWPESTMAIDSAERQQTSLAFLAGKGKLNKKCSGYQRLHQMSR
jgi:hypothetical protein